ncbi:MAG: metalloregulator ArsR/SmtB family transcription factor [Herpetosiphonaceae bacterium]|nr:metalloregulator ArsR/SmtB family transcription factor [Herpetosiphonaceae bacterium]
MTFQTVGLRTSPVGRRELLARLTALADDTRLQILHLFTERAELNAQEIMTALGLSQSSASRQLHQLRSAGFLRERRSQGALKLYRVEQQHIEDTFQALERLLAEGDQPVPVETTETVPELRHLSDAEGRITRWPSKQRERQVVLNYLTDHFEAERRYTEREVNDLLSQWHTFGDPVTLRRELVDAGQLQRERNGSSYWLPE